MTSRKRVAAAELFRQQNVAQMADDDEYDQSDNDLFLAEEQDQRLQSNIGSIPPPVSMPAPQAQAYYAPAPKPAPKRKVAPPPMSGLPTSEELQMEKEPIRVRETRFFFWRWVVVPPNVYVVHTRAGREKPVTLGLGLSFSYNPVTDSYLVVPAAMQTIGIVANGISREKQGVNVLAYVQWQIDNFAVAYRKLDFSDPRDPLGIVNAQLREQAEAAIKDKIATMSIEEVLTDKEPIIEELTTRLKAVSEGRVNGNQQGGDGGLGIKIVTVQIKEAVVSSQRLWENLQAPFRNEKEQMARMSYLDMQEQIRTRELETRRLTETSEAETAAQIELARQTSETDTHQARLSAETQRRQIQINAELARLEEEARLNTAKLEAERLIVEQNTALRQLEAEFDLLAAQISDQLEIAKQTASLERRRQAEQAAIEIEEAKNAARLSVMQREAEIERLRQDIRNMTNEQDLSARLIERLPELASHMPDVESMHVIQSNGAGGFDQLAGFLMNMRALAQSMGLSLNGENGAAKES